MLHQVGQGQQPSRVWLPAWTYVLAPSAVDAYAPVLELAQGAVRQRTDRQTLQTLGAVQFRAGQFDEALKSLASSESAEEYGRVSPVYGWYFLAMTHFRLGQHVEAQKWYDRAARQTEKTLADEKTERGAPLAWDHRLTLELLRDETRALLEIKQHPEEKGKPK